MTKLITASLKAVFADVAAKVRPRRHWFKSSHLPVFCCLQTRKMALVSTLRGVHGPVTVTRRPWGPVAILCPWNVPAGTVVPKVAAALVAGCPVILKPRGATLHERSTRGCGLTDSSVLFCSGSVRRCCWRVPLILRAFPRRVSGTSNRCSCFLLLSLILTLFLSLSSSFFYVISHALCCVTQHSSNGAHRY